MASTVPSRSPSPSSPIKSTRPPKVFVPQKPHRGEAASLSCVPWSGRFLVRVLPVAAGSLLHDTNKIRSAFPLHDPNSHSSLAIQSTTTQSRLVILQRTPQYIHFPFDKPQKRSYFGTLQVVHRHQRRHSKVVPCLRHTKLKLPFTLSNHTFRCPHLILTRAHWLPAQHHHDRPIPSWSIKEPHHAAYAPRRVRRALYPYRPDLTPVLLHHSLCRTSAHTLSNPIHPVIPPTRNKVQAPVLRCSPEP